MKSYAIKILIISFNVLSCNNEQLHEKTFANQEVLPLREVKERDFFINQIKSDSVMYYDVVKKADQHHKPLRDILIEEAEILESKYADIIRIENLIIKNHKWFEEIQNKAKQEKISIDSAIKKEAVHHISITRR